MGNFLTDDALYPDNHPSGSGESTDARAAAGDWGYDNRPTQSPDKTPVAAPCEPYLPPHCRPVSLRAESHWLYTAGLLRTLGKLPEDAIAEYGWLYKQAFAHGYKHGRTDRA